MSHTYSVGTLTHMGPGFFPGTLGVVLALIGAVVLVSGFFGENDPIAPTSWRIPAVVLTGVCLFGVLIRGAGLVPAVFCLVFVALLASRPYRLGFAALLGVLAAAFCYGVFVRGLGLPIDTFGPWFMG